MQSKVLYALLWIVNMSVMCLVDPNLLCPNLMLLVVLYSSLSGTRNPFWAAHVNSPCKWILLTKCIFSVNYMLIFIEQNRIMYILSLKLHWTQKETSDVKMVIFFGIVYTSGTFRLWKYGLISEFCMLM